MPGYFREQKYKDELNTESLKMGEDTNKCGNMLNSILFEAGCTDKVSYGDAVDELNKLTEQKSKITAVKYIITGTSVAVVAAAAFFAFNIGGYKNLTLMIPDDNVPLSNIDSLENKYNYSVSPAIPVGEISAEKDKDHPVLHGFRIDGHLIHIYFADSHTGLDFDSAYAMGSNSQEVLPVEIDEQEGRVTFDLPNEETQVYISDNQGNTAKVVVEIYD